MKIIKNEKFRAFTEKHVEIYKFIKWNLVGAIGVPVEIGSYYLFANILFKNLNAEPIRLFGDLEWEGLGFLLAFLLSTALGETVGFILNRKFTFAADANPALSIFLHFCMVTFSIIATSYVGMEILRISKNIGYEALGKALARPISTIAATAWLYPLNRFVVHRKKKPVSTETV